MAHLMRSRGESDQDKVTVGIASLIHNGITYFMIEANFRTTFVLVSRNSDEEYWTMEEFMW